VLLRLGCGGFAAGRACVFCNALAGEALPETSQRTGIMAQFSSPCHTRALRSASPREPGFC
jgi:hypothetical protein